MSHPYRLAAANFCDTPAGIDWRTRLARDWPAPLDLLVHVFENDVRVEPDTLDRQHVEHALTVILPGRLEGREPYAAVLPDLAYDFVGHLAAEFGPARSWELTSAVDGSREAYAQALSDPDRPRFATPPPTPDRRPGKKIGRNDPCPCGSGKKYKKCCLRLG